MAAFTSQATAQSEGPANASSGAADATAPATAPAAAPTPEPAAPPWPSAETSATPPQPANGRPTLGRLARVEPSRLWPTDTAFAGWLADNLEGLSEALGMQLRDATVPHPDIPVVMAADASGAAVVIVLELGAASDEGFGRLVRNVTASSAAHGVWVCADPGEEYGASVSWLNRAVDARVSMVEVAAVTIGESAAAPMFEVTVRTPRADDAGVTSAVPAAEAPASPTRRVDDWLESVGAREPDGEPDES
jgi:hypothetical protein